MSALKRRWEDLSLLLVLRILKALTVVLPLALMARVACFLGGAAGRLHPKRRVARRNLCTAFGGERSPGEFDRIIVQSYQNLALTIVELLYFPRMSRKYLDRHVPLKESEARRLKSFHRDCRGVIFMTAHFGNWEILSIAGSLWGQRLHVLAKGQKYAASDRFLNRLRESQGSEVISLGIGMRRLYDALRRGESAGVLADQDAGPRGAFVPFFGRLASFHRGVARLARQTGAVIVPTFNIREGLVNHRVIFGREIEIQNGLSDEESEKRMLMDFSGQLEEMIHHNPGLWLWPYKRWKSSPERHVLILSDRKKGHESQSLALFDHITRRRRTLGFHPHLTKKTVLPLRYKNNFCKQLASIMGYLTHGRFAGSGLFLKLVLQKESFDPLRTVMPDIVISCGAATEMPNLILSRLWGAKSTFIQRPQFGLKYFTAALIPKHDRSSAGRNVFQTKGSVSSVMASHAPSDSNGILRVGLIVGGPTRSLDWDSQVIDKTIRELKRIHKNDSFELYVTTSRRTPADVDEMLRQAFQNWPACKLIIAPNRFNPPGAYQKLIKSGDLFLVTADSVSMITEVMQTGRPVIVINPQGERELEGKLGRFVASMVQSGDITGAKTQDLEHMIKTTRQKAQAEFKVSDESVYDKVADILL